MNEADFTICAYCPRLCRHVCPAAVATAGEAAVPSVMMTAPLLVARGTWTVQDGLAATDACVDCGACTRHCHAHVPVAERLAAWRAESGAPVPELAALTIEGTGRDVCVLVEEADWTAEWSARHGPAATCRTSDALGFRAWRRGGDFLEAIAIAFSGRRVVTASADVEAVARAAGLEVERLKAPPGVRFVTCGEGGTGGPDQLACCGRRAIKENPALAATIAEENARLMGGGTYACLDQGCADWLRLHRADVRGPADGGWDG